LGAVFSPSISRQDACLCYSPRPSLVTNYRRSGLVLRRNPVVAARFDEGPFTIPFADLADRVLPTGGFFEFTTYALASRLRASWMEARVTKVARVSARFSKSLAKRRLRPNQEKCARPPRRFP